MRSPAVHLAASALLNVLLVAFLSHYLDRYFVVTGGWAAYVIVGSLITLLNIVARPLLAIIMLPLRLIATILAIIITNGIFVWIVYRTTLLMDPGLLTLTVYGGIGGWIVVSLAFGLANWVMKMMVR